MTRRPCIPLFVGVSSLPFCLIIDHRLLLLSKKKEALEIKNKIENGKEGRVENF